MPYSRCRLQWRALAVLGALLLVILVWPMCCATMPTPAITSASKKSINLLTTTTNTNASLNTNRPARRSTRNYSDRLRFMDILHKANATANSITQQKQRLATSSVALNSSQHTLVDHDDETLSRSQQINDRADIENKNKSETLRNSTLNNDNFDSIKISLNKISENNVNVDNSINTNYKSNINLNLVNLNDNDAINSDKSSIININKSKINTNNKFTVNNNSYLEDSNKILSRTERSLQLPNLSNSTTTAIRLRKTKGRNNSHLDRNERSANLSHITGTARKIQIYMKNRYLQLLPDGIVNGTHDDSSDYTILQRTTVDIGQIKIQGVATCLFLCMDTCGTVYGSRDFTDDCIFNEVMEEHHYNTYSSTYHSNARRTLYLALNRHGQTRKIQIPATRGLGKLATYTKALTETVPHDRVEKVIERIYGSNYIKHGITMLCESVKAMRQDANSLTSPSPAMANSMNIRVIRQKAKCLMNKKKKKKKRKCREDEAESEVCIKAVVGVVSLVNNSNPIHNINSNLNLNVSSVISNSSISVNGTKLNKRKQLNGNKNATKCLNGDEECVKKKLNKMKNQNNNPNVLLNSNTNPNTNHNNRSMNGLKRKKLIINNLNNTNNMTGKKLRHKELLTSTTSSTTTTTTTTTTTNSPTSDNDDANVSTDMADDDEWDTAPSLTFVDEEDEENDAKK